jgi:hypothetical protein
MELERRLEAMQKRKSKVCSLFFLGLGLTPCDRYEGVADSLAIRRSLSVRLLLIPTFSPSLPYFCTRLEPVLSTRPSLPVSFYFRFGLKLLLSRHNSLCHPTLLRSISLLIFCLLNLASHFPSLLLRSTLSFPSPLWVIPTSRSISHLFSNDIPFHSANPCPSLSGLRRTMSWSLSTLVRLRYTLLQSFLLSVRSSHIHRSDRYPREGQIPVRPSDALPDLFPHFFLHPQVVPFDGPDADFTEVEFR